MTEKSCSTHRGNHLQIKNIWKSIWRTLNVLRFWMLQAAGINKACTHRFTACLFSQREDDTKVPYNQWHSSTCSPNDPCSSFWSLPATQMSSQRGRTECLRKIKHLLSVGVWGFCSSHWVTIRLIYSRVQHSSDKMTKFKYTLLTKSYGS